HRGLERPRAGRRTRLRADRHPHVRRLRAPGGDRPPERHDLVVRAPQPDRRPARTVRDRRSPDRPGGILRAVDRAASALRAARRRRGGQPAQRPV
ncbi:MAG: Phage minor structural protein, partial [uncultured Solirubrobacteraceae bacterium]